MTIFKEADLKDDNINYIKARLANGDEIVIENVPNNKTLNMAASRE